jgi:HD domain
METKWLSPLSGGSYILIEGFNLQAMRLLNRRMFLIALAASSLARRKSFAGPASYPAAVAGVSLPRTALCLKAYALCQSKAPDFLLNHSMRTYLFGALHAAHHKQGFDPESAFVASVLHDLGLLREFASKTDPFEIDGATAAERFAKEQGVSAAEAKTVWNAIVMHDMNFSIATHQTPEATLVAAGAAADVVGPDDDMIDPAAAKEVVSAYPRLQFKREFTSLLVDHCTRKPGAQTGTWLEGFCRQHSPSPVVSKTEQAIRNAPFSE